VPPANLKGMKLAVIIPAAGGSARFNFGSDIPRSKLDEDLGGKPVIQRSIELFNKLDEVCAIIVAGPADPAAFEQFKARHGDRFELLGVTLCAGGKDHRYQTVREALKLVPADSTHIAVHDAARPCTPVELVERMIEAAQRYRAVVPGIEVLDTLKRAREMDRLKDDVDPLARILGDDGASASASRRATIRVAAETVDRSSLFAVQTPQIFEAGLLRRAYEQQDLTSTDDAGVVERLLASEHALEPRVVVVPGDSRNIKITHLADVSMARLILGFSSPREKPAHLRF